MAKQLSGSGDAEQIQTDQAIGILADLGIRATPANLEAYRTVLEIPHWTLDLLTEHADQIAASLPSSQGIPLEVSAASVRLARDQWIDQEAAQIAAIVGDTSRLLRSRVQEILDSSPSVDQVRDDVVASFFPKRSV